MLLFSIFHSSTNVPVHLLLHKSVNNVIPQSKQQTLSLIVPLTAMLPHMTFQHHGRNFLGNQYQRDSSQSLDSSNKFFFFDSDSTQVMLKRLVTLLLKLKRIKYLSLNLTLMIWNSMAGNKTWKYKEYP